MEVTLNRNGWHRKLQRFVFEYPPVFNSLCPYFWLTIFCIIVTFIIPAIPLFKVLRWVVVGSIKVVGKVIEWTDEKVCQPLYNEICKNLPDVDVVDGWLSRFDSYSFYNSDNMSDFDKDLFRGNLQFLEKKGWDFKEKKIDKFNRWKDLNPDWEIKLEAYKEKRKAYFLEVRKEMELSYEKQRKARIAKEEKQAELAVKLEARRLRKQKSFTNIVKYTQMFSPYLFSIIGLIVIFYLGKGIMFLYEHVNWVKVGVITLTVLKCLIMLLILAGLIYLIVRLIIKCKIPATKLPILKHILYPFMKLSQLGMWLGKKIGNICEWYVGPFFIGVGGGFKFLWEYIKATKENYCPAINWVDESETSK